MGKLKDHRDGQEICNSKETAVPSSPIEQEGSQSEMPGLQNSVQGQGTLMTGKNVGTSPKRRSVTQMW